jgi:hypothetical protein
VSLDDRYEDKTTLVKRGEMYCVAVDVDGNGTILQANDLTCYTIQDQPGPPAQPAFPQANVQMTNDLSNGTSSFVIDRSQMVCVQSRLHP